MDSDRRQARIKRLKREILGFLMLIIVIPWIFVIVLATGNHRYKSIIKEKDRQLDEYLTRETEPILDAVVPYKSGEEAEMSDADSDSDELTDTDVDKLRLSEEELYDGYRKVYLTFDDGPSENTSAILDILKEYNVKATFFVIYKEGREYEELYRRIVEEGHTLGMHSCTHVYSTVYKSEESFINDTNTLRDFLYMVTGVTSEFYRFPGGSSNTASEIDMRVFGKILLDEGITYFDWNMSSGDAHSPILSAEKIFTNSTATLDEFSTPVILFHDNASKTTTVEALPMIIEYIQAMDKAVILPITKETKPIQHLSVD